MGQRLCHGRGRGFESRRPRHFPEANLINWKIGAIHNYIQIN